MKIRGLVLAFLIVSLIVSVILLSGCTQKSRLISTCKKDCILLGTLKRGIVPGLDDQCLASCKAVYAAGGPEGISFIISKYEEEIKKYDLQ